MNDHISFRLPTEDEIKSVSAAIAYGNRKHIKCNNMMATIFGVIAGCAILSVDFSAIDNSLFSFFVLIASGMCVFMFVRFKKIAQEEMRVFENGAFKVVDGYLSKITTNFETNGCINVWFESDTYSNGWYTVRLENVEIGTKAIFVKPDVQLTKRMQCYVFTPFMLSEEGIKLHW